MSKYNLFNLSHKVNLSCNQGELIPIMYEEVAPGDRLKIHTNALIRVQPLLAPIFSRCVVDMRTFYVPFRILMDNTLWDQFITGYNDDGDEVNVVHPYVTSTPSTGYAIGSLADYLGITPGVPSKNFSAFPFRAYGSIYNWYYRDKQLQSALTIAKTAGLDTTTSLTLQNACWQKDYFTLARPEPQLGSDVTLPLTGDAPVLGVGVNSSPSFGAGNIRQSDGTTTSGTNRDSALAIESTTLPGYPDIRADLSGVTAATVNELRLATALQRYKENMSRFGNTYWDRLRTAFGVRSLDARLQQPEYIGGGTQVIQFSEVLQTAEGSYPVGELRGHGISAGRTRPSTFYAPEHGCVITLMTVRPETMYPQAIKRSYLRRVKEDYLTPELEHIGQQELWDGEIYAGATDQYGTFGYVDRYDEYRRSENRIAGEFRDTLKFWHLARIFASQPALNADFVKANPRTDVYAAPSSDQLYVEVDNRIKVKRRLSKVAKPMLF